MDYEIAAPPKICHLWASALMWPETPCCWAVQVTAECWSEIRFNIIVLLPVVMLVCSTWQCKDLCDSNCKEAASFSPVGHRCYFYLFQYLPHSAGLILPQKVLIYLGISGCTSSEHKSSEPCDTAALGSAVPRRTWMSQFLDHARYSDSWDV